MMSDTTKLSAAWLLAAAALIAGCDRHDDDARDAASPPAAVKEAVAAVAGTAADAATYKFKKKDAVYTAEYRDGVWQVRLRLDERGQVLGATESRSWLPKVAPPRDRALAELASRAENVVEAALQGDGKATFAAMESLSPALAAVEVAAPADAVQPLRDLVQSIRQTQQVDDLRAAASAALSLLRQATEAQTDGAFPVPKAVALLDHDALRLTWLASGKTLDAAALQATADAVSQRVQALSALPQAEVLQLLRSTTDRLRPALDRGQAASITAVAEDLKALVDLAEQAYADAAKAGAAVTPDR